MKTAKFVAAATAAVIGLSAAGFAQAAPRDWGHRGYSGYDHRWDGGRRDWRGHRGGGDGLGLALGLGILGAALVASQANSQPYTYAPPAPAYDPNYGYYQAPGYSYGQPYYAPRSQVGY